MKEGIFVEEGYDFLLQLALVLLAGNIGGLISKKFKQPQVLGQIIAGVLLGTYFMEKTEIIYYFSQIGVIMLMFIAGIETDVNELNRSKGSSSLIALGGVSIPFALVCGGFYFFSGDLTLSIFMGVASMATSVSISVQTLRELNKLKSRQGMGILGAAIIDDVVGIILLSVAISVLVPESGTGMTSVIVKLVVFFIIVAIVGIAVKDYSKGNVSFLRLMGIFNIDRMLISYALIFTLAMAFLSEKMGVAAVTGAYFAGVILSMANGRHTITHNINRIGSVVFTPIFFVSIGMGINLTKISFGGLPELSFIFFAIIGKIIGCGLGAKISGFKWKQSLQIGIGMIPRAEVAIIIASLGVGLGVIGNEQLTAVVLMVLITTLITPSLLKLAFKEKEEYVEYDKKS
ncbi:MAG: cation:proton antiporter [Peptostreptococcaceae bacterium]|nr:cation:proton antiporter [Peptostreptococcaceae bacterium]